MRGIVFTTGTRDTEKLVRSFVALGHETKVVQYDVHGVDIVKTVEEYRPDVAVYIGACDKFHNGVNVPNAETLARANRVTKMVHLCSDAADPPWWPLLKAYNEAGSFALQVAIDGSHDNPIGRFGKVALTPIDPISHFYKPVPWNERPYGCGFAGGGGARTVVIHGIRHAGAHVEWLREGVEAPYYEVCEFYQKCRVVLNDARTGSGAKRHVKGRVVEAGIAGAVLLEPRDSPLRNWFVPGEDFMEWGSVDEARNAILHGANADVAQRLHTKIMANHTAQVFWSDVFSRIGV